MAFPYEYQYRANEIDNHCKVYYRQKATIHENTNLLLNIKPKKSLPERAISTPIG